MDLATMARLMSPWTYSPFSVTNIVRSPSASWAAPRSAPTCFVRAIRGPRFSSVGSLLRPGLSLCGSALIVNVLTLRSFRRRGVDSHVEPLAQSTHTVRFALRIASASTLSTTACTCCSTAPVPASISPTSDHSALGTSMPQ